VVLLSVNFDRVPRIAPADKVRIARLAENFWRVSVHFGFFEDPDVPSALSSAMHGGPRLSEATYFIERHDVVSLKSRTLLFRSRTTLFAIMLRNSAHVIDRFKVPSNALFEVGRRIEL
jgi:KUP system potassium uptake protein